MAQPYYTKSKVTGKEYDMFSLIRILNIKQAAFYMSLGVELQDLEISQDRKTGEPIMVFCFIREETKNAFDKWCNQRYN